MAQGSGAREAQASNQAVPYLRWRTDRQDLSPSAQRAAIDTWAAREGVALVAVHEDAGVSGGTPLEERPGLLATIDAVRVHGAGVLVVARRDRLARDVLTTALTERLCERVGARVQSADGVGNAEGPEGQLMQNMVSAFAMYERALIRARTRAALAVKKARGERTGGVPLGSQVGQDGRLAVDPVEAAAVARARALRAEGRSLRQIAGCSSRKATGRGGPGGTCRRWRGSWRAPKFAPGDHPWIPRIRVHAIRLD